MPSENLLLTFRRKFGQHFRPFLNGFAKPSASTQVPVSQPCEVEPEFVQEVRRMVEAHLAEAQFNVSALCHECHTCQSQLYRKLIAHAGLSPVRFINSIRLRKAKELLRKTDLTIAEVAYETGFTSPTYFTRLFVKTFGITPTEYRKNGVEFKDE